MNRPVPSSRWFAFLRAINTGNRRLTNDALLSPFAAFGVDQTAAYQAAGNVTFVAEHIEDVADFEARLEAALADAYGFEVPTFVRSAAELTAAVDSVPFSEAQLAATRGRVQITFLRDRPGADVVADATALAPDGDTVAFEGRHWFWLPTAGISSSELPVARIEQLVGPMTMRTAGTVRRMLAKFAG